jgi:hypothetical protein
VTVPIEIPLDGTIGPLTVPGITIRQIPLTLNLGPTDLTVPIVGGIGGITVPVLDIPAGPGIGNTTGTPSSGFFHTGAGGNSGFLNVGSLTSGLNNENGVLGAVGVSGYKNLGSLLSGFDNSGNSISGIFNTSTLDFATAALASGIGNVGEKLSGWFFQGAGP